MKVSDVKTRVKRQFGDESAIQVTDSDILIWINDGQREVAMNNDGILQETISLDMVGNQDTYPLPTDLLVLRSIRVRKSATEPFRSIPFKSLAQFDLDMDKIGRAHV